LLRAPFPEQHPLLKVSDDAVPALKRHLAQQLVRRLEGWSQTDAAALVGTDQPRISDLRRGRLDRISLEQLVRLLGRVGGAIELQVSWSSRHSFLYARRKQRE
jgi:predicted XRE-type DNA-binding protein